MEFKKLLKLLLFLYQLNPFFSQSILLIYLSLLQKYLKEFLNKLTLIKQNKNIIKPPRSIKLPIEGRDLIKHLIIKFKLLLLPNKVIGLIALKHLNVLKYDK